MVMIMKNRLHKNRRGFTLMETLLVIAMLVILLAVSVVGVLTYRKHARLAEVDSAAREIYMAAQNRAILLQGSQRLETLVVRADNRIDNVSLTPDAGEDRQITVYYIHCEDEDIGDLLPAETIEPALWDGDFYIVYEPESASVIDVFFSWQTLPVGDYKDFEAFFTTWRGATRTARMNNDPMIGYYGSLSAESGATIPLTPPTVSFYNENSLRVEVTYGVPRLLILQGEDDNIQLEVTLTCGGKTIDLPLEDSTLDVRGMDTQGANHMYARTWVLDDPLGLEGEAFSLKKLLGVQDGLGGTVTVRADVSYTGSTFEVNSASGSGRDNGLFALETTEDTAHIEYLRHLQNLEPTVSGVGDSITAAVQDADLSAAAAEDGQTVEYGFVPINNKNLTSYHGDGYEIHSLTVEGTENRAAGLFGTLTGTAGNPIQLTDIRLVNTSVEAGGSAGALAGSASHVKIDDCLVYWESTDTATLAALLTHAPADGGQREVLYQITGSAVGGLAGKLTDATVTGSAAATLAQGRTAGGLAGTAQNVAVTGSYADCYLSGSAAGGLFGSLAGSNTIRNSYAAGFLAFTGTSSPDPGLYPGSGSASDSNSVTNAYYALEHGGSSAACGTYGSDGTFNVTTPPDLSNAENWEGLFGDTFAVKTSFTSHPYNLREDMALTTYPYPGLSDLDHWGDWSATFISGALAYYEDYGNGIYGFMGGDYNALREGKTPVADGYAMVYYAENAPASASVTYQAGDGNKTEPTKSKLEGTFLINGKETQIVLLPLPDGAVNTGYTSPGFYQEVTVDGTDYRYNPHFAVIPTQVAQEEEEEPEVPDLEGLEVVIRTPRHLYHLSRHSDYYHSNNFYRFTQALDLDYGSYTGAVTPEGASFDKRAGWCVQAPIGPSENGSFRGSYNGGGHVITGVLPDGGEAYPSVGLFGYNAGALRNIVYQMPGPLAVAAEGTTRYAGGLTGTNAGTVENCAVYGAAVSGSAASSGALYLGGLAGQNQGAIRRSAAEGADLVLSTNFASGRGGGFVGRNSSQIVQCYAVGRLTAVQEQPTDRLSVAGFAGDGGGETARSYAAVDLVTGRGEPAIHGFSPTGGQGCVYLNNGVFTYREESFTALYEDDGEAVPVSWPELTGETASDAVAALGMSRDARAVAGNPGENGGVQTAYPLPAVVTDGQGAPTHYGQWPERVPLGGMGVFYWEALAPTGAAPTAENTTYHLSAIAADLEGEIVRKLSTLSAAHDDGKVVAEYGYGYYASEGLSVTAGSQNISWTRSGSSGDFNFTQPENTGANQALGELIKGYIFRCFDTIDPERGGEHEDGLYCTATDIPENDVTARNNAMARPGGAWTLSVGGYTLTVDLDPFFADAMSLSGQSGFATVEGALNVGLGNARNPYQVRSIDQLRFINWNAETKNCSTVLTGTVYQGVGISDGSQERSFDFGSSSAFPYLSYGEQQWRRRGVLGVYWWEQTGTEWAYDRPYHWRQSHDIHGGGATYSPIAELYDTTSGRSDGVMHGWFGGTYNGDSYMIEEVNIQGGDSSCAGLFGAVANGKLENITLYSEHGAAVRSRDGENGSVWYAIGGLAGVAAAGEGSAIENCAVAGYQIIDTHEGGATWGGTSQGGLIGMSSMNLTGCTAVTQVTYGATDYDNERVGGLVGSCHGTITNCYAGGSIAVTGRSGSYLTHGIYVGGLAGGTYMKQLRVPGHYNFGENGNNSFINCYSYVRLPNEDSSRYLSDLYAVAGKGDGSGSTAHQNCYYLREIVLADNSGNDRVLTAQNGVNGVTYDQLSAGGAAYNSLLGEFQPVTALNGRFSYGSGAAYTGLDYPFPAILTQPSDLAENNTAYVHYGWWPLYGIVRADGNEAVQLNLFSPSDQSRQVELYLARDVEANPSGGWAVEAGYDESVVSVTPAATAEGYTLTLTARGPGETVVTVSCGGYEPLEIHVVVSATLSLAPDDPIRLFPGESQEDLALTWSGLSQTQTALVDVSGDFTVSYEPERLSYAQVTRGSVGTPPSLSVTAGSQAGETGVTVSFAFRYGGSELVDATSFLPVTVLPLQFQTEALTLAPGRTMEFTAETLLTDGAEIEVLQVLNAQAEGEGLSVSRRGLSLTLTAAADAPPGEAGVRVQVRFQYEGAVRTAWATLPVTITANP